MVIMSFNTPVFCVTELQGILIINMALKLCKGFALLIWQPTYASSGGRFELKLHRRAYVPLMGSLQSPAVYSDSPAPWPWPIIPPVAFNAPTAHYRVTHSLCAPVEFFWKNVCGTGIYVTTPG